MIRKYKVSPKTRNNWLLDSVLGISALLAGLSGIYFLYLPMNGYQGGRNPYHDLVIFFTRHTWGDIHLWAGVAMIAVAALHIPLHWTWIVSMTKRMIKGLRGQDTGLNGRAKYNLVLNASAALGFLITSLSGLYFWLVPGASHESGLADPAWLFTRTGWDLIHTWGGILLIASGILHFAIHWKWVTKVTAKIIKNLLPDRTSEHNRLARMKS